MEIKRKRGRPRKLFTSINTVRQVGRWTDEDWQIIRDAAETQKTNVAAFAKSILLRAARRLVKP